MRKFWYLLIVIVALLLFTCFAFYKTLAIQNITDFFASVFFTDSITVNDLHDRYNKGKIKILIVPGHDDVYSGTSFKGLREADLTVELARQIADDLKKDPHFEVTLTREGKDYTPEFLTYFSTAKKDVLAFQNSQRTLMASYLSKGQIAANIAVDHNVAPSIVAYRLYAINKWANDHKIDLVIHVHFNDYAGRKMSQPGKYSGFSVYIPEGQYSNAKASRAVADKVFTALANHYPASNLPLENSGIIADQELIAIGANNSLDAAAFLTEYGYIYEKSVTDPILRSKTLATFALDTYQGLENFFNQR